MDRDLVGLGGEWTTTVRDGGLEIGDRDIRKDSVYWRP